MSGVPLTYKLGDTALEISINIPRQVIVSNSSTKGVVIEATNRTFSLNVKDTTPIQLLTALQDSFKDLIQFDQNQRLDTAVSDTMVMIGNLSKNANILDLDVVRRNKTFAKFYYKAFISKDYRGIENSTNPMKETVKIVIDLFTWWYIRRLVHIFVVFTIIESLSNPLVSMKQNPVPQVISPTSDDTNVLNKLKIELASLQDIIYNQSTVIDDKNKSILSLQALKADVDKLSDEIVKKDKELSEWKTNYDNLKELLIHSTSMIFKFDEVPNLLMAG